MDPITMANSALNALNAIKQQLQDCEAAFAEARQLNKQIQGFEVTILMIPTRAKVDELVEEEQEEEDKSVVGNKNALKDYAKEGGAFVLNQAKDKVMEAINTYPIQTKERALVGTALQIFNIGKDAEPIFDEKEPGKELQKMKKAVDLK